MSKGDETLESHGTEMGRQATTPVGRVREWVLVEGDRLLITILLSLSIFVLFLVLSEVGIVAFTDGSTISRLAGGMIAGTFSLVTLVVSINQLILSKEFASAGDARDQLESVEEFRGEIADTAMVPAAPASPVRLLELLVETIRAQARTLDDAVARFDDEEASELIRQYTNSIEESANRIDETLENISFGTFTAVSAAIGYDSAWQLYAARHLRERYGDSLPDEAVGSLDQLIAALEQFTSSREHFKTTYLQRELTRFSQLTIYCGVPAILSAMLIGFVYADYGGPTINAVALPYVVSGLVAVVITPLSLLVSYILRTATVTRRTASVGPMLPQKDPEAGPFDVSYGDDAD